MEISVWAPHARQVTIDLLTRQIPMRPRAGGWWSSTELGNAPVEYAFRLDGGPPLPDPRSSWQRHGVHGPSCTVDHARFEWTDLDWAAAPLSSAVVYELHIGTFTPEGTFDAAVDRIPHLLELGVTHVELMPVAQFPGTRGWGYDGVYLYAPHDAYGGPDALKRLVNALHSHGIAAILDVVYNHLGPSGNYLQQFGPYFTEEFHTPWGAAVNLSGPGSAEVRRFLIDNALTWLRDYHFDGLRIDAVHALLDASSTHFLDELARHVRRLEQELARPLSLIAESDLNDPRVIASPEAGGYGLTAQWSDDFHHALHTVLTAERSGYYVDFGSLAQLAKALECGFVFDGVYSQFRSRPHGSPLDGIPLWRLLGYLQTHDQIGNRARGERISALTNFDRVKIGAALVLLGPFTPMLFQGEEWAASTPFQYFTDHVDPDVGRAVTEGRRREFAAFGWNSEEVPDPQDVETFQHSKLAWSELRETRHQEIFEWYRDLIALRKQFPDLRAAPVKVEIDEARALLVMRRGRIEVVCNLGQGVVTLPAGTNRLLRASHAELACREAELVLPPDSIAITVASELLPAEDAGRSSRFEAGEDVGNVPLHEVAA
jgi:maltooligosyltrehalose trehalohydrolase